MNADLTLFNGETPEYRRVTQADLDRGGLVRHDHPDTAHEAAQLILPRTGTLRRRVLDFVTARGSDGATDLEIQQALGMDGNTERPRRVELVGAGFLVDSGEVRVAHGRQMIVWKPARIAEAIVVEQETP